MYKIENRSGFTLVELLLAIFLVSLFAYFVFATPRTFEEPKVEVNITNLPQFLQTNLKGDGELVCINNCKECYFLTGSIKSPSPIPFPLALKVENEYILDRSDNPVKIERGRFKDQKVCLRLRHYKNGSISQVILELEDRYIFIPSFFGEGKEFGSLGEAADWWIKDNKKFDSKSNWY
ncbi:MAG: prepilin-type N-terminal cleavage/methylation domain-containing protein [Epsilonproteobacteria bacterium]|nr:prepilin-type N-terminal cleavage/methylation domain-containing protein [Campylobacterota bacterium]